MGKKLDLIGKRFKKLVVKERIGQIKTGNRSDVHWSCQCDCGKTIVVPTIRLNNGDTKSCGCLKLVGYNRTHGDYGNTSKHQRILRIWKNMLNRCYLRTCPSYRIYGARGIRVCDEWQEYLTFKKWSLENGYKDTLSLDRIENGLSYEPSNCRWTTSLIQSRNMRTNVIFEGECAVDASLRLGGNDHLVAVRLYRNWSLEKAFTTPAKKNTPNKGV